MSEKFSNATTQDSGSAFQDEIPSKNVLIRVLQKNRTKRRYIFI